MIIDYEKFLDAIAKDKQTVVCPLCGKIIEICIFMGRPSAEDKFDGSINCHHCNLMLSTTSCKDSVQDVNFDLKSRWEKLGEKNGEQ